MREQDKNAEIDFFDKLCESGKVYDTLDNTFYSILLSDISNFIKGTKKVLEIGCGTGIFGEKPIDFNPELCITGIDITPKMVEIANSRNIKNYHAIVGDIEDEKLLKNQKFDIIIAPFVLHHLPKLGKVFFNIKRSLNLNGFIIIIEPNGSNPINIISKIVAKLFRYILGESFISKLGAATPNEIIDHRIKIYTKLLDKNNIKTIITIPYFINPKTDKINIFYLKTTLYFIVHKLFPPLIMVMQY